MAKVEIELNHAGIVALMQSDDIADVCEREAQRMTRAAGIDYKADVYVGRSRVNAAGFGQGEAKICPKCGRWHVHCSCG